MANGNSDGAVQVCNKMQRRFFGIIYLQTLIAKHDLISFVQ